MNKFGRYLTRRAGNTLLLLLLVSFSCFILLDFAPGSFFDEMRLDPQVSPATVAALRHGRGLQDSGLTRYRAWLWATVHGDPGISFAYNRPVLEMIAPRVRNTLLLTVSSLVFAWTAGIALGAWSAYKQGSPVDRLAGLTATALLTVPELVLGCFALLLAVRSRFLPVGGMLATAQTGGSMPVIADLLRHMILPVAVLTLAMLPLVFRHSRSAVLDVAEAPFVRSARAHGLSRTRVLFQQILPAAANPLISLCGISLGGLLSASLIIEVLFGWPGVGPLFLDAVSARDPYLIIAIVLCSSIFLIGGNFLADLFLYFRDPRMRTA